METQNIFAFLAISMITMCFGWGMRGSAIGGEKGAMLPGAFMGILCVWYTGSELLMDNVYLFAAACALGYFYGGMEPYGSTMSLVLHHDIPRYNPPLGYLALAFKEVGGQSGLSKTNKAVNSLAHRTTWLRSDLNCRRSS